MTDEGGIGPSGGVAVTLDPSQRAVLELPAGASAAVLGAPGTGKTTTLVELLADRVLRQGWSTDEVLVLTTSRVTATRLRDRLALRLARPTTGPLARTVNSLAFDIVGRAARAAGVPSPRLITGGEQDADLAGLLAGHEEDGSGPLWPEHLGPEVRRLRGFRTELRELMMRATEYGVAPERLRELGVAHDRPEWVAAGDFMAEYDDVLGLSRPSQLDSAELVARALALLGRDEAGELVSRLRLVVVDDFQEATESVVSLLRALAARGVAVVAFGDPDIAANAFRGGEPDALGTLAIQLGVPGVQTVTLSTAHRQGPALRQFTSRVTERVGTAAAGSQRRAAAGAADAEEPIVLVKAHSPAREWASLARMLRKHHLSGGVPFGDMAVVVRSGAQVPGLARALALAEVPTRTSAGRRALREDHAARALLTVVDVGMGRTDLSAELATQLLLGPFGGLDRLTLRRLRLALRAEEFAGDGNRSADELVVEALAAPGRFATIDHRVARRAERLATTLAAVRRLADEGGTIEELLWLAWDSSGLAKEWSEQSLSAGIAAAEANRNLDGIVALFSSAKRFVERLPGSAARVFLEEVLEADVPEDSLSPQSHGDAVLVTTPSGVVGLEFAVVAVAALQEGAWPNMRIRGSLLGPQQLVRAVTGIDTETLDERRLVRDDELRMFALAVSRARTQVILTAADNDDEAASVLFELVPGDVAPTDTSTLAPLSLRGLTGRLRRELARAAGSHEGWAREEEVAAASGLAHLAAERVPGADPDDWHGLLEPSSTGPLFGDDEQVPVSPSKLEAFEDSPVDWFIESIAGTEPSTAMGLGTIIHWAMETATDPSVDTVWRAIESRWQELLFEAPWVAEHQKVIARRLAAAVAEYLGDFERDGKTLVGAESRFSLDIERARVNGSIDRVERAPDGSIVIVDLKTGRPITAAKEIDAHPQLGVYQLAYAQGILDEVLAELGEHRPGGAKLVFVKEGIRGKSYREGVQAPLTPEQLDGFRDRIRAAATGMAAAAYEGRIDIDQWGGFGTATRKLHRVSPVSAVDGAHRTAGQAEEQHEEGAGA
ncbi:ATP-dependent helicase [Homoserinimonas aerilata]|nr:ATP-dependent DNA helicase [Homoserinimonas aerilata]